MQLVTHSGPAVPIEVEEQVFSGGSIRVAGDIQQALRSSGYAALRRVNVAATTAGIVLRGTVPSYHLKQLAQEVALRNARVAAVTNDLHVEKAEGEK